MAKVISGKNLRIAIGYWLAACNAADGAACGEAAALIRDGTAGYADQALAFRTAQRVCDGPRDPEACALLELACHRGEGTARDPARAATLWQTGCAVGEGAGSLPAPFRGSGRKWRYRRVAGIGAQGVRD